MLTGECERCGYVKPPDPKVKEAAYRTRRREATRGRECKWCGKDDEVLWSNRKDECSGCQRQKHRRACGVCQGPFYLVTNRRVGRMQTGCLLKNRTGDH